MDLFTHGADNDPNLQPLAERMRPTSLDELVGQRHLLGPGTLLRRAIEQDRVPSMILWGPPGVGKTTIARVIANVTKAEFISISAVLSGVKEIREVVDRAAKVRALHRRRTLLFVDEIHRFNKTQQDALLPHVERGVVTLVGATTENPSFEVNAALLSRARVFALRSLSPEDLVELLQRALKHPKGLGPERVEAAPEVLNFIARAVDGDARKSLLALEVSAASATSRRTDPDEVAHIDITDAEAALQQRSLPYDKGGEHHFNLASAFIKSMRGSDPDAAVYYMVRMLEGGEPPRFLTRRMVIFAAEDVGNADPNALRVALDAAQASDFVGLPEAVLPLTMAATYLAMAPKSNSALTAYASARRDVLDHGALDVPLKLRNAPTGLMKGMGYGGGYRYPHDFEGNYVPEEYLPDALRGRRYYQPADSGQESEKRERLEKLIAERSGRTQ